MPPAPGELPKPPSPAPMGRISALSMPKMSRRSIFPTAASSLCRVPIRSVRTQRFKYIRNIYPDAYHTNHSDILRTDGAGAYWDSWELAAKNDAAAKAMVDRYYRRPSVEFYDLRKDPEEQVNLADHPEHQAEISRLSNMVDDWMKRQGDTVKMQRKPYTDFLPTRVNVPEIREREERQKRK